MIKLNITVNRSEEDRMSQYIILTEKLPERLQEINKSKKSQLHHLEKEYAKFKKKPTRWRAKWFNAAADMYSDLDGVLYKDGLCEEDMYYWLGFATNVKYEWNERFGLLDPIKMPFFKLTFVMYNKKTKQSMSFHSLSPNTLRIISNSPWYTEFYVDASVPSNHYILGLIRSKLPADYKKFKITGDDLKKDSIGVATYKRRRKDKKIVFSKNNK